MSNANITFAAKRVPTESNYITIWSGDVTEQDLYKFMDEHNLETLNDCEIGLRNDNDEHPTLRIVNHDPRLIPEHLCCFNGCSCNITIPVKEVRQDRYRTLYYFENSKIPTINIVPGHKYPA